MNRVYWIAAILAVNLFTGCSSDRSSGSPRIATPDIETTGRGKSVPYKRNNGIVSPVYKLDIDTVQDACVAACMSFFHRVDKDDRLGHTIFVNNNNFWAGDTDVNISLVETNHAVQVNVESHGAGFNQPLWNRSSNDLNGFYSALDREIRQHHDASKPTYPAKTVEQRLLELKSLKDNGVITEEEYQQKRTEILKSL